MPHHENLPPLNRQFVAHFGEMGSRWGINRTVGQIYALLFISAKPLNADDITEALEFSRSNVSMGLKELQAWAEPGDWSVDGQLSGGGELTLDGRLRHLWEGVFPVGGDVAKQRRQIDDGQAHGSNAPRSPNGSSRLS